MLGYNPEPAGKDRAADTVVSFGIHLFLFVVPAAGAVPRPAVPVVALGPLAAVPVTAVPVAAVPVAAVIAGTVTAVAP